MPANTDVTKRVLNIRLPANLYELVKRAAESDQRSINNLVIKWLREKIKEENNDEQS